VDLVDLRFQAGRENKGALLQTQALAAQAQWQARRAERSRREASEDLARLLGRDGAGDELAAAGDLVDPAEPPETVDAAVFKDLPALRQSRDALLAARQDRRAARAAWWPTLGASASAGRSGGEWLSDTGTWSAGLSLSLPIFQGGSRVVDNLAAESRLAAAELALRGQERQSRLDLRRSLDGYQDGVESARVQASFLKASEVRAEVARAQYTQGLLTFDTWDQIETDLINAQISALSSRGDAQRAAAAWDRDLGWSPWR
jgi:outer membrane protein TolC